MPIDYWRIRNLTAPEFINALLQDGFTLRRQKAATSDTSMRQAGWTEADLERLKLIR